MKSFIEYVVEQDELTGGDNNAPLGDLAGAPGEENLDRITKIALEDYKDEMLEFFEKLAKKDGRVREELDHYKKGGSGPIRRNVGKGNVPGEPGMGNDVDVIVPSTADNQGGQEEH